MPVGSFAPASFCQRFICRFFSSPLSAVILTGQFKRKALLMSVPLFQFPPHAVIAHYAPAPGGGVQVVTVTGQVLGSSFFAIRHQFSFVGSLAGSGLWVVLAPVCSSSFSPAEPPQPSLL